MKKMRKLSWLFLAGLMAVFTACSNADDEDLTDGGGGITAPSGEGTEASPYNVTAAIAQNNSGAVAWVKGYIVGQVAGIKLKDQAEFEAPFHGATNENGVVAEMGTNLLLAASKDETDVNKCVVVQLPYGDLRTALELVKNPSNDGKELAIKGSLVAYFGSFGLKECSVAIFEGKTIGSEAEPGTPSGNGTMDTPYNVAGAVAQDNSGDMAWVKAYIVGQIAGSKLDQAEFDAPFHGATNDDGSVSKAGTNLLLADKANETNVNNCLIIQLPIGDLRTALELVGIPTNDGKQVQIYGKLEEYFKASGLKSCTAAIFEDKTIGKLPESPADAIFSETFASSMGNFVEFSVLGEQIWGWRSAAYGVVMSGFTDKSNANEDWLISPAIDLTGKTTAKLSFDHAINKGDINNLKTNHTLWFSTNYASGNPATATWEQVEITTYPAGNSWTFVSSDAIAIPAKFQAANVRIAFKYLCSDTESASWEIKNFLIK